MGVHTEVMGHRKVIRSLKSDAFTEFKDLINHVCGNMSFQINKCKYHALFNFILILEECEFLGHKGFIF